MEAYNILEKTIELIEDNLDNQDLNISFLSKKVFVSSYHLQRIFYSLFGKTIGSYIRERRLTEAGTDIKNGERIVDVAINIDMNHKNHLPELLKSFMG